MRTTNIICIQNHERVSKCRVKASNFLRNICVCGLIAKIVAIICAAISFAGCDSDHQIVQQHIADLKENNDRLQSQVSSLQSENHALQERISEMKFQMRQKEQDAATRESSLQENYSRKMNELKMRHEELLRRKERESKARELSLQEEYRNREANLKMRYASNNLKTQSTPQEKKQEDTLNLNEVNPPRDTLTKAEISMKIRKIEQQINQLRMKNPACEINPDHRSIRNTEKFLLNRDDKRYYKCSNKTLVRRRFYCTYCEGEFDGEFHGCKASKAAFPLWRAAKDNVAVTLQINAEIDSLMDELVKLKELKRTAE